MKIRIRYFAELKQLAGVEQEVLSLDSAISAAELYQRLRQTHQFRFDQEILRVAVNGRFEDWAYLLKDGDEAAYLPPFSGG